MSLSKEQLKRANRVMFISLFILCIIMGASNVCIIISRKNTLLYQILLCLFVVSGICIFAAYKSFLRDKRAVYIFTAIWIVMVSVGIFTLGVLKTYSVGFAIILASVSYLSMKLTLFLDIMTGIIYCANLMYIIFIKNEVVDPDSVILAITMTIIISVVSVCLTVLFRKLAEENSNLLIIKIEEQNKVAEEVEATTEKVSSIFELLVENSIFIKGQSESNKESMHNLASIVEQTASEIQNQALATENIQNIIMRIQEHLQVTSLK